MRSTKNTPSGDEIWQRVKEFAENCRTHKTPVFTLHRRVRNFITEVTDTRIGRNSDEGHSKDAQSAVSRGAVLALWDYFTGRGERPKVLYFTLALMAEALPDVPEVQDGVAELRRDRADGKIPQNPSKSPRQPGRPGQLGTTYRRADEKSTPRIPAAHVYDPDNVGRGYRSHSKTQNHLADFVEHELGATPRSPNGSDPQFDLLWQIDQITYVAEIKSLTTDNEERQLRLAVGQVLRYRQQVQRQRRGSRPVRPVIALERAPTDQSWKALCTELGILLVWPKTFAALRPHPE